MTTERWNDDQLDQLANAVDGLREQAESNTRNVDILVGIVTGCQERLTRIESGLERLEQAVRSNNRFLESFSTDIRRYVDTMNNLATRIDGVVVTNNQDRQEANSRLATRRSDETPPASEWTPDQKRAIANPHNPLVETEESIRALATSLYINAQRKLQVQ